MWTGARAPRLWTCTALTTFTLTLPAWAQAGQLEILNYFGLDRTAKGWFWTLAPASRIPPLLPEVHRVLDLSTPGRGILFTIPLSGISAQIPQVLLKPEYEKEEPAMEEAKKTGHPYQLVLTIVNRGSSDQVMEAARSAGAGSTVIYARRVGYEDVQNMLGFTLQPEKEIVPFLCPQPKSCR